MGKQTEFAVYDDDNVDQFLNLLPPGERRGRGAPAGAVADDDAPPPDAPGGDEPVVAEPSTETMDTN